VCELRQKLDHQRLGNGTGVTQRLPALDVDSLTHLWTLTLSGGFISGQGIGMTSGWTAQSYFRDMTGAGYLLWSADGLGLISYRDLTNADLKVAHCTNTACTAATYTTLDSAGTVGYETAVTIGADGLGLISYRDLTNDDLKMAQCANVFCIPYFRRR